MTITHSRGSYSVRFAPIRQILGSLPVDSYVVTDENVNSHYRADRPTLALPPGEQSKSLIWLERVAAWLADSGASRKSLLVALGGGVIGDLAGFAAATYMRGIPYVQIPTTLLAQVDSSVGGKVAVDIPSGKNLVGSFYPPSEVAIDTAVLKTLSLRQRRNGMAEVLKYGFIMDASLLQDLPLLSDDEIVARCISHKAKIVAEDEFETNGLRAILNFGHTVGHALEQATGYREFLHGEAISIGMIVEAHLGEQLGITATGASEIVKEQLELAGLPTKMPPLEPELLLQAMKRDKKAMRGKLAFSLLTQIGGCKLVENVDESEVVQALGGL